MQYHQQPLVICIFLVHFSLCSSKSNHAGHLKPFGSSGPFEEIEEVTDGFPSPFTFFDKYLFKSRPVLFRQALVGDPHFSLWKSDEQMKEIFADNEDIVHVETRKKETRKQDILSMTMKEFLERYQREELYLVEEVPPLLRPYLTVPNSLQCKAASETFQVAMMWFSSGNTSSVVHTDDYDNINCVLQGDKRFILIDPLVYPEVADEIIDNPTGSYSSVDVDRVDYKKYPSLDNENVHYYQVDLTAGDCIFLPALLIHQVRSTYRNIAVNYWLEHERTKTARIDRTNCAVIDESNLMTLETIPWPSLKTNAEYLKNYMLDLIDDDATDFKDWTREFSKELGFDLQSNVQTISWFAEFFNLVDTNSNGYVTYTEVESLFQGNNGSVAYDILQDILDIMEVKMGKTNRSNDTLSDGELTDESYHTNETMSSDAEDDYTVEHEDL